MWRAPLCIALVWLAACGRPQEAGASGAAARRIASLSPAITATVLALGWGDRLVGRTPWCAGAEAVPVVGSLLEVDLERLDAAHPDLVLVQRTASGPPAGLVQAAQARGWRLAAVPCTTLQDVRALESAVQRAVGEPAQATDTERRWHAALQPLPAAAKASPAALLFSIEPVQAFGTDTYLAAVWSAWGGRSLPELPGHPSLRLEDLSALPLRSVLVVGAREGAPTFASSFESRGVAVTCVAHAGLLRPGPELLEAVEAWRRDLQGHGP